MKMNDKFLLNSTWTPNEESVSLREIISIEDFNNSEWSQLTEGEVGKLTNLNCDDTFAPLELVRRNKNESCTLMINLEDPCARVTKIIVISEAKIIEIYGKHGEYICTERAQPMGCLTGKQFFIAESSISSSQEVTFKFHESGDTLWLYGITLLVVRNTHHPTSNSIDFTNVDQILRSSNVHLTENAERAKAFIMDCNSKTKNDQNEMGILQSLLQKWNALGGNTCSKPVVANNVNNDNLDVTENGNKESDGDIKQYLDSKLQQLEERVQNKVQLQLKEFEEKQNEKLDSIIEMLQKKTI